MKMKLLSFFSGCGILDLGFENAGFEIALVNEFHKSFLDAYLFAREHMNISQPEFGADNLDINSYLSDRRDRLETIISTIHTDKTLVGFIGGPPCPDFSVAGKQRGRDGDNGKLSLSYVNLIVEMKPDFFVFENVKGLWRTSRHREFYEELKEMLKNAGYCLTDKLVNSLEYGVPQDRDRIILIGVKKSLVKESYITNGSTLLQFPWDNNKIYSLDDISSRNWPKTSPFIEKSKLPKPENIIDALTVEYWFRKNDVKNHPDANRYFTPKAGLKKMMEIDEGDVAKKSYKRLHRWRYSPTVAYGNNEVHLHPYEIRRLSLAEAMSLQSLPKEFTLPPNMTLSDGFKTIGNGVPFLMANGIAQSLKQYLNEIVNA